MVETPEIPEGELASIHSRLLVAVDEVAALLVAAADVHRRAIELQASLAEPLVELERLLRDVHEEREPG